MGNKHYLPLPDGLTIKDSGIHGLGLYTTETIGPNVNLGITHIKDNRFENGYSRTPLGGFFNHSKNPNCTVCYGGDFIYLETLRELAPGEEITVTYTFYDPTKNTLSASDFLEIVRKDCAKAGVNCLLPETEKVVYPGTADMMVSGYFDSVIGPTLACAIGKPEKDWYEILIHESCHMDQWSENSKLWLDVTANGVDCDKGMDEWLAGKELHRDEYTYYIRTMQFLEIDCERRSVKKIKDLGIDIDTVMYTKKANSYLFFYSVMLETHKWSDVAPYNVPEIVDMMPGYFLEENDYCKLPDELLNLYKTKCYENL